MPIVSLILGIVSLCCYTGWLTGPAALITGYIGMKILLAIAAAIDWFKANEYF